MDPAVADGPRVVPGVEDGVDRALELLPGILGKVLADLLLDDRLEALDDELLQVVCVELGVEARRPASPSSASMSRSNLACSTPSTTSPYIWMNRR